jgi:hypothetical protein
MGDAVSSPPAVLLQIVEPTEQETVLITRSPGTNDVMVVADAGAAIAIPTADAKVA